MSVFGLSKKAKSWVGKLTGECQVPKTLGWEKAENVFCPSNSIIAKQNDVYLSTYLSLASADSTMHKHRR